MITDLMAGESIFTSPDLSTKMKILHAVNKSLDQITVSEICRNAGISRQTFYRHFESKYDIPWWYSIFCRQFYLNEIGRTIDWKTGYYHHLRLIVEIFSKLECEVMNDWFRSDEPIDLARWTDDLVSLVPDRLYRALEIPSTAR